MPRTQQQLTDLRRGEVTPKLRGRTESGSYDTFLETLENCFVEKRGGVFKRPGMRYVGPAKFLPSIPEDPKIAHVRLVPFVFSNQESMVLEFGDRYVRFYQDGGIVENIAPYSIYLGDGTSTKFTFPYPNVDPGDIEVLDVNGNVVPSSAYTVTTIDTGFNYAPPFSDPLWDLDGNNTSVPWTLNVTQVTAPQDEETTLELNTQLPLGGTYTFTVDVTNVDHYSRNISGSDATDQVLTSGAALVEIVSAVVPETTTFGVPFDYQFTAQDTSGNRTSDFYWEFRQNNTVLHAGTLNNVGASALVSENGITAPSLQAGDTFSIWVQATGNHAQSLPQVSGTVNPSQVTASYVVDADAKLQFEVDVQLIPQGWDDVTTEAGTQTLYSSSQALTLPNPINNKLRCLYGVTCTLDNPVLNATTPGHFIEFIGQFDATKNTDDTLTTGQDYTEILSGTVADGSLTGFSIPVYYNFLLEDVGTDESVFEWEVRQGSTVLASGIRQTDRWHVQGVVNSNDLTGGDSFGIFAKATEVIVGQDGGRVRGSIETTQIAHFPAPPDGTVVIIRESAAGALSIPTQEKIYRRALTVESGIGAQANDPPDYYEIQSPFEDGELDDLYWTQANDQMWFCHKDHKPWLLTRWGINDFRWSQPLYEGAPWEDGDYSPLKGYPRCVTLFQERLIFAATLERPQTLWLSRRGEFYDFTVPVGDTNDPLLPDDPLEYTLASHTHEAIQWLSSERVLVIGTSSTEHRLAPDQFLATDRSPTVSKMTDFGGAHIMPVYLGELTAFVQWSGTQLRSFQQRGDSVIELYESLDLGWLSDHLFVDGIKEPGYALIPDSIAYMLTLAGNMLTATYDPTSNASQSDDQFIGWAKHNTRGAFMSITSIPYGPREQIWAAVTRVVNGVAQTYIEYFEEEYKLDSNLSYISPDQTEVTVVGGMEHMEGEIVSVVTDKGTHPDQTVVNGQVNLSWPSSIVAIGAGYNAKVVTMPYEGDANPSGTSQGLKKRWSKVHASMYQSPNPKINGKRPPSRDPQAPMDVFQPFGTELIQAHNLGIDKEGKITIEQDLPVNFHLLAIYGDLMIGQG